MLNTLKKFIISNNKNIIIRKLHDRKLPDIKYIKNKPSKNNKYIGTNSPRKADYFKNNKDYLKKNTKK